jgi:hypothetical protein
LEGRKSIGATCSPVAIVAELLSALTGSGASLANAGRMTPPPSTNLLRTSCEAPISPIRGSTRAFSQPAERLSPAVGSLAKDCGGRSVKEKGFTPALGETTLVCLKNNVELIGSQRKYGIKSKNDF